MVAVEAMASGKPVIVSRVGGLQHIIEHGVTGFSAPSDDSDAWVEILIQLINDPDLRRRISERAAADVREKYTWDHIVESYYLPLFNEFERTSKCSPQSQDGIDGGNSCA